MPRAGARSAISAFEWPKPVKVKEAKLFLCLTIIIICGVGLSP
jgi:hypothetical protein